MNHHPLDTIRIASPCDMNWNDMPGDERMRFCKNCSKSVFNISGLTRDEVEVLFLKRRSNLCVKLFRRSDGTVMFEDCPAAIRKVRSLVRLVVAIVTGFLSSFLACPVRAQGINTRDPAPPVVTGVVELGGAFLSPIDVDEQDSIEAKNSSKNRRAWKRAREKEKRSYIKGVLSENLNQTDRAIDFYRMAIRDNPKDFFSYRAAVRLLEQRNKNGDQAEAKSLRKRVEELETRESERLKEEERRRIESRSKETIESPLGIDRKIGKDHR